MRKGKLNLKNQVVSDLESSGLGVTMHFEALLSKVRQKKFENCRER